MIGTFQASTLAQTAAAALDLLSAKPELLPPLATSWRRRRLWRARVGCAGGELEGGALMEISARAHAGVKMRRRGCADNGEDEFVGGFLARCGVRHSLTVIRSGPRD
jgi:hypothetical protein